MAMYIDVAQISKPHSEVDSPHDSLSPIEERHEHHEDCHEETMISKTPIRDSNQTKQNVQPQVAFPDLNLEHATATPAAFPQACQPRFPLSYFARPRCPAGLRLTRSNGFTNISSDELRCRIRDGRTAAPNTDASVTQIPRVIPETLPPTPTTPFTMGNKPSSISSSPAPDDASVRSVVRCDAKPVSRKGSFNIFKRVDSRSPLSTDAAANGTTISHPRANRRETENARGEAELENGATHSSLDEPEEDTGRYPDRNSHARSASTATMTEARAAQPLSASTTIRDLRSPELSPGMDGQQNGHRDSSDERPPFPNPKDSRSALSPTIPAPSPLPANSPHKYGLRDDMETPDIPESPEKIDVTKIKRTSSGLEIFNRAKSLQSASSFLNSLSTSRRRADSAAEPYLHQNNINIHHSNGRVQTTSWLPTPNSRLTSSSRRASATEYQDGEGRCRGHHFKTSGFAYTRPLTLAQLKCYQNHARLIVSSNKAAPVECAICHIDDDKNHWSCSWCAIRMCGFCRKDFAERGMTALRERIKIAEMGSGADETNGSSESSNGLDK